MPLLGLIITKIICVFYGIGNILYSFLIINKTEIWALRHKKNAVDAFGLVAVATSPCDAFPLVLTPLKIVLGFVSLSPFSSRRELQVPAQQSCSQAVWAQPWTLQGNSGVGDRQSQMLIGVLFFLQLSWCSSMGRVCRSPGLPWEAKKLTGMEDEAVLPCILSLELFLGLCLSSACERFFHGVGLHCGLCPFLPTYCPVLDNWGSWSCWKCAVFRNLLILTILSPGSCDLFAAILKGHSFSLVQGSKQINKMTLCVQKLQKWACIINADVTSCWNPSWLWGPGFGHFVSLNFVHVRVKSGVRRNLLKWFLSICCRSCQVCDHKKQWSLISP